MGQWGRAEELGARMPGFTLGFGGGGHQWVPAPGVCKVGVLHACTCVHMCVHPCVCMSDLPPHPHLARTFLAAGWEPCWKLPGMVEGGGFPPGADPGPGPLRPWDPPTPPSTDPQLGKLRHRREHGSASLGFGAGVGRTQESCYLPPPLHLTQSQAENPGVWPASTLVEAGTVPTP